VYLQVEKGTTKASTEVTLAAESDAKRLDADFLWEAAVDSFRKGLHGQKRQSHKPAIEAIPVGFAQQQRDLFAGLPQCACGHSVETKTGSDRSPS
jgi:hypothetical protein